MNVRPHDWQVAYTVTVGDWSTTIYHGFDAPTVEDAHVYSAKFAEAEEDGWPGATITDVRVERQSRAQSAARTQP